MLVFDGYVDEINSAKTQEHRLRSSKTTSREIYFDLRTTIAPNQEDFSTNGMNKARLISFLKQNFVNEGIPMMQARGDADSLIIGAALKGSAKQDYPVVVVGNDTDLQVALITTADLSYNLDPAEIWKISSMQNNFNEEIRALILVAYCFTGCDSTSMPFKKKRHFYR